MDRQMDMFADGGLEQDGGTNDPVSGNEVPPGSTQKKCATTSRHNLVKASLYSRLM